MSARYLLSKGGSAAYREDVVSAIEMPTMRPVVVIDPEDRRQVERLRDLYDAVRLEQAGPGMALFPTSKSERGNALQAALRSLIAPPKPPEPTGLGAVVEDANGDQFVRTDRGTLPWFTLHNEGNAGRCDWTRWSEIHAVKVLSEGVA